VSGVPAADPVPSAQKLSGDGWSVESSFNRAGGSIQGVWTATMNRTRFELTDFPDLKQFWSAASKAASPGLTITP
jgi:hypothetical protein